MIKAMGVGIACIYGFNHQVTSRESIEFEENIALNNFGIDSTGEDLME